MTRRLVWLTLALLAAAPARAQHRPRLTFDGRDTAHVQRVRDHVLAREAPWSAAYESLRRRADTARVVAHGQWAWKSKPDKWAALYGQEVDNARVARAQAAAAWLGAQGVDPTWLPLPKLAGQSDPQGWLAQQAQRACDTLGGAYDRFPGWRGFDVLNRGIVAAEALLIGAQAWDLLAALPAALRPSRLEAARTRLCQLAEDLNFYSPFVSGEKAENHQIRVKAGIGGAGLAFPDQRARWWNPGSWWADAGRWREKAERCLDPEARGGALRLQIQAGCYAEGTSYQSYAYDLAFRFLWAWARCDGGPALQSPRLDRSLRWSLALRLPDGARPPVDNAGLGSLLHGAYLVNRLPRGSRDAAQRALLGWDWLDQGSPGLSGAFDLDLLAAWDPTPADEQAIAAQGAPDRSAFLADEGAAVLRDGGGRDAAWALMLAEHGPARELGQGHEDVDPLAFQVYAQGDLLALDPGYGGWTQVKRTREGVHHNILLVDGEAPKGPRWLLGWQARGADAFLDPGGPRTFHDPALQSAAGRSSYCGADIERTVCLVAGRVFLVEDRVRSRKGAWPWSGRPVREVTAQFHANGGAKKAGPASLTPLGLRFASHRLAVPVEVAVTSTAGLPRLALERSGDAIGAGQADEHAVLRASVRGKDLHLLTAAVWGPPGQAPLPPQTLAPGPDAAGLLLSQGDTTVAVWTRQGQGAPYRLTPAPGLPELESDGTLVVVAWRQGVLLSAVAHEATLLRVGSDLSQRSGRGTLRR